MAAGDQSHEDLLIELLVQFDDQLTSGVAAGNVNTSLIADDDELLAEWESDRRCLEMLHRVRRGWSPESASLETPPPLPAALLTLECEHGQKLGRFRIVRELGHGGLGVVYLAYDPKLHRQVALKVPRPEALLSADLRRRFLREAEAAARLNHPNLVSVYDSGEDGSVCYIASEFCPGPTLNCWLKERGQPVSIRSAARLVKQLAEAVGHAHGRGVLHRDIKPSNVLLERPDFGELSRAEDGGERQAVEGTSGGRQHADPPLARGEGEDELWPRLTDFGMAKLLEREGEETRSGALVGTPAYMSPEQARGSVRDLDARTDIYALGAILYEILTRRRVIESASDVEALRQVLFDEPTSPRKLRSEIPRDLEAICLKCLSKSTGARYATAQQLVDDLNRFLTGSPTEARPLGTMARVWKWAQRRPALAALLAVVAAASVAVFSVVIGYNARLSSAVVRAELEAEMSRRLLYTADVRVAYETLKANNIGQAIEVLDRQVPQPQQEDLREFAWYYLREQCEPEVLALTGHGKPVMTVAFSPDGSMLASGGGDGAVRLWSAATGDAQRVLRDGTTEVTCLAFAPLGGSLAAGNASHTIRLWEPATGQKGKLLSGHTDQVLAICFSPDGKHLASGGSDATVRIWDADSDAEPVVLNGDMDVIRGLTYSPDGQLLFAVDEAEKLLVWQTGNWERMPGALSPREKFFALAVSPNGRRVAAAGRREVIGVWESTDNGLNLLHELTDGHNEWIQALAYSPTDDILASAGKDGILRLWRRGEAQPHRTLLGHKERIWSIAWSPDGRQLASGGADGLVRIWPVALDRAQSFRSAPAFILDCEFSPDGSRLVAGCDDGLVRIWDVESRRLEAEFRAHERVRQLRISPNGALLATRAADSETKVWEFDSFRQLLHRSAGPEAGSALAWDPKTGLLATTIEEKAVILLDVVTNRIVRRLPFESKVRSLQFTPDGRYLVATSTALLVWDLATGRVVQRLNEPHTTVILIQDGRRIAASTESNVTLLELESDKQNSTLVTIGADVWAMAASPDGRTLALALLRPHEVALWDLRTKQQLMRLECDAKEIRNVEFSPDGRRLVATGIGADGKNMIWEWTIGQRSEDFSVINR